MSETAIQYAPLVRALFNDAAKQGQPVAGTFELTESCNLSCGMCYIRNNGNPHPELKPASWNQLAQEAGDHGLIFLILTGGEIFSRNDFFEIYIPLTKMGFIITLLTNGTLISETIAERLADNPPNHVEITLYGASKRTYEKVTGVPGSFEKCQRGIQALLNHDISSGLKTTLTRLNVHELSAMKKMANNWGLPLITGWLLMKRRDGSSSDIDQSRLSSETGVSLELADSRAKNVIGNITEGINSHKCLAGRSSFTIGPSGAMNLCSHLPFPGVHPLNIGFKAAWKSVRQYTADLPPPSSTCLKCEYLDYCPRCPAWSFSETGTLKAPVPYLCRIARLRKMQ